jgi:hypothetical protein
VWDGARNQLVTLFTEAKEMANKTLTGVIIALSFGLTACTGSNPLGPGLPDPTPGSQGTMSATVDGAGWASSVIVADSTTGEW